MFAQAQLGRLGVRFFKRRHILGCRWRRGAEKFFQYEFAENLLIRLAKFLKLEPERIWIKDSLQCYQLGATYEYEQSLVLHYKKLIHKYFMDTPELFDQFLNFVNSHV